MSLGERIAAWRVFKGWDQFQLAKALGVTRAAVYQWEAGTTRPSALHLEKLAAAFGVTLERFFGRLPRKRAA